MTKKLYLASASPRRQELLRQIGLSFEQVIAPIEEVALPNEMPESFVRRMAIEKAFDGYNKVPGHQVWVLGGDTLIQFEDKVFEKPRHKQDAIRMLKILSGKTHQVLSAIAIVHDGEVFSDLVKTNVTFKLLSDDEIEAYWLSGEPEGKAGAYAIQGQAAKFIQKVEGSYTGVVGLPLFELEELLKRSNFYAK